MRGDVPVDSEAPVVTSSISRPDPPAQYLGDAHRVYVSVCVVLCFEKKKKLELGNIPGPQREFLLSESTPRTVCIELTYLVEPFFHPVHEFF